MCLGAGRRVGLYRFRTDTKRAFSARFELIKVGLDGSVFICTGLKVFVLFCFGCGLKF